MSGTLAELQRLLRERQGRSHELTPQTQLVADLALDSLEQLDLIVELENHFAIALELDEGEEIETVGQLVAWIDRTRGAETPCG